MGKWLFVTGTTRGSYTAVEPDGETREVVGLDVNLGTSSGANKEEALQNLLTKLSKSHLIPECLYKKQKLIAYKIEDDGEWVDIKKELGKAGEQEEQKTIDTVYENVKCKWCSETLPKNGAAQFSHLKKHLKQLMTLGKITLEQFNEVRSVQLTPEMTNLMTECFKHQTPSSTSGPIPESDSHK